MKWDLKLKLMQILCLLGMYFDAVVVEVEKYLLLSFCRTEDQNVWPRLKPRKSVFFRRTVV